MCHSLGRNRLEKLYMGNDFNRSLCCICMDRDNDTENDKEVEKTTVCNKQNEY